MTILRPVWLLGLALLIAAAPVLAQEDEETANDKASAFCKNFKRVYKKRTTSQLTDDIDTIAAFMVDPAVDEKSAKKALMGSLGKVAGSKDPAVRAYLVKKCAKLVAKATASATVSERAMAMRVMGFSSWLGIQKGRCRSGNARRNRSAGLIHQPPFGSLAFRLTM